MILLTVMSCLTAELGHFTGLMQGNLHTVGDYSCALAHNDHILPPLS